MEGENVQAATTNATAAPPANLARWPQPDSGPQRRTGQDRGALPAGDETGFGNGQTSRRPRWAVFDPLWYGPYYAVEEPFADYRDSGARRGRSPNLLFDEIWYLARYPDIGAHVAHGHSQSGFAHYCLEGYRARSPNAYFDETFYQARYPELFKPDGPIALRGYANGYDHYLTEGAESGYKPSPFFEEAMWSRHRGGQSAPPQGHQPALEQHFAELRHDPNAFRIRTCWYFDPEWYLKQLPNGAAALSQEGWISPLAHYLGSAAGRSLAPNPFFDEAWYTSTYADVTEAVARGVFRNGFSHFLSSGLREGRQPTAALDLTLLDCPEMRIEIDGGLFPDSFSFYVARHAVGADGLSPAEVYGKQIFAANARLMARTACRTRLDFRIAEGRTPEVSVIIVLHNQFDFTMASLASLRAQAQAGTMQLILVDSGSTDHTSIIQQFVYGAEIMRHTSNIGYIAGCNAALPSARADLLLYMNNDVILAPGALPAAIERIRSRGDVGAVGGRVVRSHGKLQEAGCIIWRDGRTTGYLRDQAPDVAEAQFVREVDFCSAAFLLTRTAVVRALGGFSTAFLPAYYEDADLGVRLRALGYVTLYDPAVLVHHYEYGSSDRLAAEIMMAGSRSTFLAVHARQLRHQFNYRGTAYVRARSSRRDQPRILVIEDRVPRRCLGAGYVRSNDIVWAMDALGYAVTVYPIAFDPDDPLDPRADFPDMVEVLHDRTVATIASFLAERAGDFAAVWICRTHNLDRLLPVLANATGTIPDFGLILDSEAVVAPRQFAQAAIARDAGDRSCPAPLSATIAEALVAEFASAGLCQKVVAVSRNDAALISFAGHDEVSVLGHLIRPEPTDTSFAARRDLLFIGSLHDATTPNYDSLVWFVAEVLPLIAEQIADIALTVVGYVAPKLDVTSISTHPRVRFIGAVDDLAPFHAACRVFVAPTRFAAGIPYKVHEAAARGVPVIATTVLCTQLDWQDGIEVLDGGDGDPVRFAQAVVAACTDAGLWHRLRAGALERIGQDHSTETYHQTLGTLLADIAPLAK